MRKKPLPPDVMIAKLTSEIESEISHWKDLKDNGCSDPFYQDGINMNLVRNHVIYYKRQIRELCEENDIECPEILNVPTPPKVDNTYMADMQCERAKRIRQRHDKVSHKKIIYDENQLNFIDI